MFRHGSDHKDEDMLLTGKRHDFLADYEVGFDQKGAIRALLAVIVIGALARFIEIQSKVVVLDCQKELVGRAISNRQR
jgi:xanthine dehydrogenase molybdopterin-binding subunit B